MNFSSQNTSTAEKKASREDRKSRDRRRTRSSVGISRTQVHDRGPVKVGNLVIGQVTSRVEVWISCTT